MSIPDHELLRCIGRGSYGEVWLARHARLGALRAVKIVRRDCFGEARRFQREFAGLQKYEPVSWGHPNLMAILHVGGADDHFYCVMELADRAAMPSIECLNRDKDQDSVDELSAAGPAHLNRAAAIASKNGRRAPPPAEPPPFTNVAPGRSAQGRQSG